jgi:hypothetical protein
MKEADKVLNVLIGGSSHNVVVITNDNKVHSGSMIFACSQADLRGICKVSRWHTTVNGDYIKLIGAVAILNSAERGPYSAYGNMMENMMTFHPNSEFVYAPTMEKLLVLIHEAITNPEVSIDDPIFAKMNLINWEKSNVSQMGKGK